MSRRRHLAWLPLQSDPLMNERSIWNRTAAELGITPCEFVAKLAQQREEASEQSQTQQEQERLRQWAAKNRNRGTGNVDLPHQARPDPGAPAAPSLQALGRTSERLSAVEIEALLQEAKQASRRIKELREAEARRKP